MNTQYIVKTRMNLKFFYIIAVRTAFYHHYMKCSMLKVSKKDFNYPICASLN